MTDKDRPLPKRPFIGPVFRDLGSALAWQDEWDWREVMAARLEATQTASGTRRRGTGRAPGRPRISEKEREAHVHLRDHCDPRWEVDELLTVFMPNGGTDPKGTIKQRLTRWRADYPRSKCSLCAEEYFPTPLAMKMTKLPL